MPDRPFRAVLQPRRVRAARAALFKADAAPLLEVVRSVLCEPTRTQIVRALSVGPLSVGDLGLAIGRGRTVTSQHLRVLRAEQVVAPRRRGRRVYYAIAGEPATLSAVRVLDAVAVAAG
jgi:DNA-binding transcriptional ArsR family regulator